VNGKGEQMAAGTLDLNLEQGVDFLRKLIFQDNAVPTPNLEDLTGQSFRGQIRQSISNPAIVVAFTFTILDQTTNRGEVEFSLTNAQTTSIPLRAQNSVTREAQDFAYDIERVFTDGRVERVLQGIVKVSPEVTR
jgi:hypothetical protein